MGYAAMTVLWVYNPTGRHSALNYASPNDYEHRHATRQAAQPTPVHSTG